MGKLNLILSILSLFIIMGLPKMSMAYTPERGNVTATLGPYISKTNFDSSNSSMNTPNLGGLSLTALGDVDDKGSLEIAMIYLSKIYFRNEGAQSVAEKVKLVHISMGYRRWISNYFSASLGVFTSYPMGDSEIVHSDFPQNAQINTTATEPNETGLDLALQLEVWNKGLFALVLEGRYSLSLTKLSNEHADQYGGSIGLRYFIQGKDAPRGVSPQP